MIVQINKRLRQHLAGFPDLNSIKLHGSLYTNEWEFVRNLHVMNAFSLTQGDPF